MKLVPAAALAVSIIMTGCSVADDDASATPEVEIPVDTDRADDLATRKDARARLVHIPGERVPDQSAHPPTGEVPVEVLDSVIEDAGKRTGLVAEDIEIVRSESLIFSDGSLGCPKPDVLYTQVPVPGYRIVLTAGGQTLDYRVTDRGHLLLCE